MPKHHPSAAAGPNDEELVRASLGGGREAFASIIARYQSLVCALTFSGTGSLNRSEDLAQETFIVAWKRLAELRDPAQLRAWLCGIARNLTRNSQRAVQRDPVHLAEPFESHEDAAPPQVSPAEQAISREEETILWRSIEQLAPTYREPLVLFYREHRSVAEVAAALDLSEDAAKQRLARGRALLQAHVVALVETTLERSKPGPAFTLGVMAVLPLLPAATATSVITSAAVTKSGATAKTATWLAPVGAMITAQVLWFVSSLGLVAFLGGLIGWNMGDFRRQARAERTWMIRSWWMLLLGLGLFVAPAPLWVHWADGQFVRLEVLGWGQTLLYGMLGIPLCAWAWHNHLRLRGNTPSSVVERNLPPRWLVWAALVSGGAGLAVHIPSGHLDGALLALLSGLMAWWGWRNAPSLRAAPEAGTAGPVIPRFFLAGVALGTCVMIGILVVAFVGVRWATLITPAEARQLIVAHPEAQYQVTLGQASAKTLSIVVPGTNGERPARYYARFDEPTLALLRQTGVRVERRVDGDFGLKPNPFRHQLAICLLGLSAGSILLARALHQRRKGEIQFV